MAVDMDDDFGYGQSGLGKLVGIGKTVAGIATGNPAAIAGGASGLLPDSPLKNAIGIGKGVSNGIDAFGAMKRRLGSMFDPGTDLENSGI